MLALGRGSRRLDLPLRSQSFDLQSEDPQKEPTRRRDYDSYIKAPNKNPMCVFPNFGSFH